MPLSCAIWDPLSRSSSSHFSTSIWNISNITLPVKVGFYLFRIDRREHQRVPDPSSSLAPGSGSAHSFLFMDSDPLYFFFLHTVNRPFFPAPLRHWHGMIFSPNIFPVPILSLFSAQNVSANGSQPTSLAHCGLHKLHSTRPGVGEGGIP